MASIYYSILYPPKLPIDIPAFELGKPSDTWRLYLEPSVGNKPSDFKGGFIRIRNSETERSSLFPGTGGYLSEFLPFRNPFAEYNDLKDPTKSVLQPSGYRATMPYLQVNERGEFFIDIRHEVFTLSGAPKDTKYKVQVMLTTDWLSSTGDYGKGTTLVYDENTKRYENIDTVNYFGGNLVQKGLSEWSSITRVAPVSVAKYELQIDGDNIFSPIYEFVGSSVESNIRNNNTPNYLKAYRINIHRAEGTLKELFVDSSDWVIGQEASNLEIRWQNKVELENNRRYIVELDIQTIWNLRKTFTYHVQTSFEGSLFRGEIKVLNDHDNARTKIILKADTPLTWGPRENFDIDPLNFDFAQIEGEVGIEQGIDLYSKDGSISGEMILTGISPIASIEESPNDFFLKLTGPPLTIHNPIQEEYSIYAYSMALGREHSDPFKPYVDDIVINPILEGPDGQLYQTYLDSQIQKAGVGAVNNKTGAISTIKTNIPSSHSFFYFEDPIGMMWKATVTIDGVFTTELSHKRSEHENIREIHFYDSYNKILVKPTVTTGGIVEILSENIFIDYDIRTSVRPMFLNEFRLVKKVYALELGRKTLVLTQTYKAFFTDFNRKLGGWDKIDETHKYYIYFTSDKGQLRLIVRQIDATRASNSLDRFTATYLDGGTSVTNNSGMYLVTEGLTPEFLPISDFNGDKLRYVITADERGVLVAEEAFIAAATSRSKDR